MLLSWQRDTAQVAFGAVALSRCGCNADCAAALQECLEAARTFLDWLKRAEEDSEESEDSRSEGATSDSEEE
jgi:hypothetical protein